MKGSFFVSVTSSPRNTTLEGSSILHYRATEIAVRTLSPVAITVRISQEFSVFKIDYDYDFSLFSITNNPKNSKSLSISSRLIV
jgi:hypothetical protein